MSRRMTLDDETPRGPGGGGEREGSRAPLHDPRHRALRRAVRPAHAGDDVVGDARPDGGHRPARGDLAGRRPAGHERRSRPRTSRR